MALSPITKSYGVSNDIVATTNTVNAVARHITDTDPNIITDADGRKMLLAGTVYPANDATAEGVVRYDYDFTEQTEQNIALIYVGDIKGHLLPAPLSSTAQTALPGIKVW